MNIPRKKTAYENETHQELGLCFSQVSAMPSAIVILVTLLLLQ